MKMFYPKRIWFVAFWMLWFGTSFAQPSFKADILPTYQAEQLDLQFNDYRVFRMDMPSIQQTILAESYEETIRLEIGENDWTMVLAPNDLRGRDYVLRVNTSDGVKTVQPGPVSTYMGHLINGSHGTVRLSVTDEMLYGYVRDGNTVFNMEPLRYFVDGAAKDLFVIYRDEDVKPRAHDACGVTDDQMDHIYELKENPGQFIEGEASPLMECRELEIAIAHDRPMFIKKGSEAACEAHGEAIMNLVQGNFDDEFFYNIQFIVVTQYVETNNPNFPTASTNAGQVLSAFRNWGNAGGFNANFDLGQLWTNRDFDGGTVGIAYLSAVCSGSRYHALQDYTANTNQLRCMTSHEIGHNFSCVHDAAGSPTIMAPSVSGSNVWSAQSVNQLNNFASGAGCLNICFVGSPPQASFSANPEEGCVPLRVQFQDQSTGPPDSWFWQFPGGTPSTSTQQNPLVTYNTPGLYDVTLVVTNGLGQSTEIRREAIVVNDRPQAGFFYLDNQRIISFNNTSQFGETYNWTFGDGFSVTGRAGQTIPPNTNGGRTSGTYDNPVHRYDRDDFYLVILTVSGDCGNDVYSELVEVVSPVTADFVSNQQEGCAPFSVEFYDNSTENARVWEWKFPGGNPSTSTDPNPVVSYDSAGVFNVILTVANTRYSDTKTRTRYISVDSVPIAHFGDSTVNLTVHFKDSSVMAKTYKWYFGDGDSSSVRQPVHRYSLDTTYLVTQIVGNLCGFDTLEQFIAVGELPEAGITASNNEGCPTLQVQFTDASSPNTTRWFWNFPGGTPSTSNEANPQVSYDQPGRYNVRLIAENGLGRDTIDITDMVIVEELPNSEFSYNVNMRTIEFMNLSSFANTYVWDFGDGNSSTEQDPVHNYASSGTYQVTLITSNDCGNDTIVKSVTTEVNLPTISIATSGTSGCVPFDVVFQDNSSNNPSSWKWTFENGTPASSTQKNPTVRYMSAGTFDVTLEVTNQAGTVTEMFRDYITAFAEPVAGFNTTLAGLQVNFTNTSSFGSIFSWDFGDGNTSKEENPVHVYGAPGDYTITLISTNQCGSDTITNSVSVMNTAVRETLGLESFQLYPNPNDGMFTVQMTGVKENSVRFEVMDVLGRVVHAREFSVEGGALQTQLDAAVPSSGNYYLRILLGDRVGVHKVWILR